MSVDLSSTTVKDAAGVDLEFLSLVNSATQKRAKVDGLCDSQMTQIDPATHQDVQAVVAKLPDQLAGAVPIIKKGSAGTDLSIFAAEPVWPHLGEAFGADGGPYSNWVHLGTVDASGGADLMVQNFAGEVVLMLLDDGQAEAGHAPQNATPFVLPFGIAGGAAPNPWPLENFKGRAQFYAQNALQAPAAISIRKL